MRREREITKKGTMTLLLTGLLIMAVGMSGGLLVELVQRFSI